MGAIWQGAAMLMLASLLNKFLSFIYRMLVIRLIGPEGMGLYEMVFPFYSLVLMIATAGVPVAMAKLTAEKAALQDWGKVGSIFRISLVFLTGSGLFAALVLWQLAPYLSGKVFADSRVYHTFTVMLVALPVVCVCSGFRGYFQGLQLMGPVALAQVSEQITRVGTGLFLGFYFLPYGVAMAAAGLAMGMVLGEVVGLAISGLIFWLSRSRYGFVNEQTSRVKTEIGSLARLSLPVMLARVAAGGLITLEALLIPRQLQAWGATVSEATSIYGQFAGIAFTLVYLPMTITIALAIAMVPAIAEAQAIGNYRLLNKRCLQALKVTIFCGLPFAVVFFLLATPICNVVFATPEAGTVLSILAVGALFIYLEQTLIGILNGLGAVQTVLFTTIIGGIITLIGIYFFTPLIGISGAAWGINIGCAAVAILNLFVLKKYTHLSLDIRTFILLPMIATGCLAATVTFIWGSLQTLSEIWRLFQTLLGSGLVYALILLMFGVIKPQHFSLIIIRPK